MLTVRSGFRVSPKICFGTAIGHTGCAHWVCRISEFTWIRIEPCRFRSPALPKPSTTPSTSQSSTTTRIRCCCGRLRVVGKPRYTLCPIRDPTANMAVAPSWCVLPSIRSGRRASLASAPKRRGQQRWGSGTATFYSRSARLCAEPRPARQLRRLPCRFTQVEDCLAGALRPHRVLQSDLGVVLATAHRGICRSDAPASGDDGAPNWGNTIGTHWQHPRHS